MLDLLLSLALLGHPIPKEIQPEGHNLISSVSSEIAEVLAKTGNKTIRMKLREILKTIGRKSGGKIAGAAGKQVLKEFGIDPNVWDAISVISKDPRLIRQLDDQKPDGKILKTAKDAYAKYYNRKCNHIEKPKTVLSLITLPTEILNDGEATQTEVCIALHNIHVTMFWLALRKVPPLTPVMYKP